MRACTLQVWTLFTDASAMAARFPLPPVLATPAPLPSVLAPGHDMHARQRELVRASLLRCPDKGAAKPARNR
jgi:hypothetical protein